MKYEFELVMPVAQYSGDFEATRNHAWTNDDAQEDIACLLENPDDSVKLQLVSATFREFDSTNPRHACAYWDAVFEGPAGIEEVVDED